MKKALSLIILVVTCLTTLGQDVVINENFHFTNLNIKDGLPSSEVYEIFQDSKGYLWIGTDKGVARYNGDYFENFTTNDGLSDNSIFMIREDKMGRIWFLGLSRKICYYQDNQFHSYPYNDIIEKEFQGIYQGFGFSKFEISEDKKITVGVSFHKVIQIDSTGKTQQLQSNLIKSIHDKSRSSADIHEYIKKLTYTELNYIGEYPARLFDQHYYEKIYYIDSTIYVASKKGVLIGKRSDPDDIKTFLSQFKVTSVCKDFEGGMWYGTQYNGLIHVPNKNIKKFKLNGSELKSYFHGILIQNHHPYFIYGKNTSKAGVVFTLNKEKSQLYLPELNPSVFEIPDKQLRRGVKFETKTYLKEIPFGVIALLKVDSVTYITSSSNNFLVVKKWNGKELVDEHKIPGFEKTLDLFNLGNNQILIGTINGLFELDLKTLTRKKVKESLPFANLRIQDIDQNNAGEIIIATRGNGLFIWSDVQVKPFTQLTGHKPNIINQIYYHRPTDEIYIASNMGMSKLLGSHLVVDLINKNHGLESTDIRQFLVLDDALYLANNNAITYLPINQKGNVYPKPYIYENYAYFNDTILLRETMAYDENDFQVSYTGISFKSPKGVVYNYKMEPLQKQWHETRDNNLAWENLAPGDYHLEIRAKNSIGLFSTPLVYNFKIDPPYYKQPWFKLIFAIIIIVLIYILTQQGMTYYKRQLQAQKNIKQLQSLSLQAKMNPHFIFNSLNSIQNFILKNDKEQASEYLLDFAQLARLTISNSDSTTVSLYNELKTLRIYTSLEKKRIRRTFHFFEKIDSSIDQKACFIPSLLLQPYVENAIWHGRIHNQPNGFIELKVELNDNILYFEIVDNGIGVNASKKLKNKLNLASTDQNQINEERIKLIGELHANLSPVEIDNAFYNEETQSWYGTKVSFSLPYQLHK